MTLEFLPYDLTHQRLKEAAQTNADKDTLLRLALDAEEALTAYRERLEGVPARPQLLGANEIHHRDSLPG